MTTYGYRRRLYEPGVTNRTKPRSRKICNLLTYLLRYEWVAGLSFGHLVVIF